MTSALVLNAGGAWSAYQAGALEDVVARDDLEFDIYAGAGLGALNAAFVACDALDGMQEWWDNARSLMLGPGNWLPPGHASLISGRKLRRFFAAYLSDARLAATGRRLAVSLLNLQTGMPHLAVFPGADISLLDAIAGATATPGLLPPIAHHRGQLVEDMVVDSFPLRGLREFDVDDVVALIALDGMKPRRRRRVPWYAAMDLGTQMHLKSDVHDAVGDVEKLFAAGRALEEVEGDVADRIEKLAGAKAATELRQRLAEIRADVAPLIRGGSGRVRRVEPSRDLGYPPWRFRPADLRAARRLGYEDARAQLARGAT